MYISDYIMDIVVDIITGAYYLFWELYGLQFPVNSFW